MLVDTHCHLDMDRFDSDRAQVVERAVAAGVTRIIVPALDVESAVNVLRLAEQHAAVYAAVGVHPNSSADWTDGWIERLRRLAEHEKVVAIGEIGLDYHWDRSPKETQKRAFRLQLALAVDLGLPVIIHNRESDADILGILREVSTGERPVRGVLHSFATNWEVAQQALKLGYYLGFTGPVTYPKTDDLREVVRRAPLDRILVETDAPFLPPQPRRGQRNEPAYVQHVAERIAAERGLGVAELEQATTENAERLFVRLSAQG